VVKKGDVVKAVIVRSAKVSVERTEPISVLTRTPQLSLRRKKSEGHTYFWPVARELREKNNLKILSLARRYFRRYL
jgi:ribosomal protein L14